MGVLHSLILLCILSLISSSSYTLAQQPYAGVASTTCGNTYNSTSVLGYSFNGLNSTCQSYLIFRSQTPYNTVPSIAALLGSDPSQLAQINSVSETATFETNKEVIVPVNCSRSGQYYQANTSYIVESGDTYFLIAKITFQGLSTCQAIQNQTNTSAGHLSIGQRIPIPLRCACPTKNQTDLGVKYLLNYAVTRGDSVSNISLQFGADTVETLEANKLSKYSTIYPYTTLLVPLRIPPSSSQTITTPPEPSSTPPPSSPSQNKGSNKTWVYVAIAGAAFVVFLIALFILFCESKRSEADPMLTSKMSKDDSILKKSEDDSGKLLDQNSAADISKSNKVYNFEDLQSSQSTRYG